MKRYNELTKEELAALDEAGIERLIDVELAYQEIPPVPLPEKPQLSDLGIERTDVGYVVGNLIFKNQSDAEQVAKMTLFRTNYKYEIGYNHTWLEPLEETQVTVTNYWKKEDVLRLGLAIKQNSERQEEYRKQQQAYDKYLENTSSVRNEVWLAVHNAQRHMCAIETATQTLLKYKDLADGDEEVAKNFFRNTYKNQPEMLEAVLGEKQVSEDVKEVENLEAK